MTADSFAGAVRGPAEDERLLALAEAGRRFAQVTELPELEPLAAELALEVLAASSASLSKLEPDRGVLRVLRNAGDLAAWEVAAPTDEVYNVADFPLLATTVEEARPWYGDLDDPDTGEAHHRLLREMGMQSSISLPIMVGTRVWGELGAARRSHLPPCSPGDVAAGKVFCGLLGAAISRIEERDELHALAYHDALTGLGNRRAVDDRLELLFSQTELRRSIALVLCDVDGLKLVNDRFGHDAGDRLLREVAASLTVVAGRYPGSLAARLGGDEFCLLLEGLSESAVQEAADRIVAVSDTLPLGAGLSCGWSRTTEWPGDAPTPTAASRALLRLADAAQYRAKRAGRGSAALSATDEVAPSSATDQQRSVETVLRAVRGAAPTILDRLRALGEALAGQLQAASWVVSHRVGDGPLKVVAYDRSVRSDLHPDHPLHAEAEIDPESYPATEAALAGGSLHATMDVGEASERTLLAAFGFDEIIAAGRRDHADGAWLVEVFGDAASPSLGQHIGLLRALVEAAVVGAGPVGPASGGVVDEVAGGTAAPGWGDPARTGRGGADGV